MTVGKHGGDRKSENIKDNNIILDSGEKPVQGTSNTYALRKLRKDRGDLHEVTFADVGGQGLHQEGQRTLFAPSYIRRSAPAWDETKKELEEPEQLDITDNISNINRDTPTGNSRNYTVAFADARDQGLHRSSALER
jgi:hypothetical protein